MTHYWRDAKPVHLCHSHGCRNLVGQEADYCEACAEHLLYRIRDDRHEVQAQYDWFEVAWYWVFVLLMCLGIPCMLFNVCRFLGWL